MSIKLNVTNIGNYDGAEVVQCYVRDVISSITTPMSSLKAFNKVFIGKGETEQVELKIAKSDLMFWNRDIKRVFEPGEFEFSIGSSQDDIRLKKSLILDKKEPVDYVNPMIGTADSRPMQFPGAAMPFGMVKLSPDNQKSGWKAAHDYKIKNIAGFNFIHDYQMTGFYMLPVCGSRETEPGTEENPDLGYRSRISNESEVATPGYYSVFLDDYKIKAELSSTTRVGVQRYTFPKSLQVDASNNNKIATKEGYSHYITSTKVKFIRINMLKNSVNEGVHIVELRLY